MLNDYVDGFQFSLTFICYYCTHVILDIPELREESFSHVFSRLGRAPCLSIKEMCKHEDIEFCQVTLVRVSVSVPSASILP